MQEFWSSWRRSGSVGGAGRPAGRRDGVDRPVPSRSMIEQRRVAPIVAVAVLAAALTLVSFGLGGAADAATMLTFRPVADATVDASSPSTTLGTKTTLVADGSPVRVAYLRFSVSGLAAAPRSAHLRLHVQSTSVGPSPSSGQVSAVASTVWSESTVSWSTRPAIGAAIDAPPGPAVSGSWLDYDVSGAVTANGLVSFAITQVDFDGLSLDARESGTSTAPQLVLDSSTTSTTTTTTTTTTTPPPSATAFDVAAFGDVPYSTAVIPRYDAMIAAINAGTPSFAVHVGDIGTHLTACNTAAIDRETARFDTFQRAVLYTPGDNEWADCGSAQASQLAYLRSKVFRGTGTRSRGRAPLTVASQAAAGFPENARWSGGRVTFATLHVVGSADNGTNPTERAARQTATAAWLHATFAEAKARGDLGVVLFAQAAPSFGSPTSAYQAIYEALRAETLAFPGPVLYVHGDGHTYVNDRPMSGVANLQRIEVEGSSTVSYVNIRIDPSASTLFTITPPRRF